MHLEASAVLLFILLTGGFSLICYDCWDQHEGPCEEQIPCDAVNNMCTSRRQVEYYGDTVTETNVTRCALPDECESWSFNTGYERRSHSIQCCHEDLCNKQVGPDLYSDENGKQCFTCHEEDCSNTVSCRGNEDYCFTDNEYQKHSPYQPQIVKGCASKYICDDDAPVWLLPGVNITCCSGDLCNGVKSVTQSFLFLCCSLLSFILLH
ncbi:urokinase plasminogen activator surface receptor-like [Labeo rohita]|uniref:urokinase plasminogen activator surface receptor-like n=1 Tax=Labeo rohita TaxID=84645 RepID=UPI0021E277E4|nr:urokinase plasminogen activator surface receptor-like [Labeo rohita]